jgi:hypothetical protein
MKISGLLYQSCTEAIPTPPESARIEESINKSTEPNDQGSFSNELRIKSVEQDYFNYVPPTDLESEAFEDNSAAFRAPFLQDIRCRAFESQSSKEYYIKSPLAEPLELTAEINAQLVKDAIRERNTESARRYVKDPLRT